MQESIHILRAKQKRERCKGLEKGYFIHSVTVSEGKSSSVTSLLV